MKKDARKNLKKLKGKDKTKQQQQRLKKVIIISTVSMKKAKRRYITNTSSKHIKNVRPRNCLILVL